MNNKHITYTMDGYVYGNLWGGGQGAYPSVVLRGSNIKQMLAQARKDLNQLDSGMGYESILGALLYITKITEVELGGKLYTNTEYLEPKVVGNLTQEQIDFIHEIGM